MSDRWRLSVGILLIVGVAALGMRVVPSIPPVSRFFETRVWLTGNDVTQFVFLTASLALVLALSRGHGSLYGLRWVPWPAISRAVRASLPVALVVGGVATAGTLASRAVGGLEGDVVPSGGEFLKLVVSIWIGASISEELFFRGLVQGFLSPLGARGFAIRGIRLSLPVTIAAVAFGLGHVGLLGTLPPPAVAFVMVTATILGIIAGRHREATGSVVPAIAAHMTFNIVGAGIPIVVMLIV
jgi:membrane protease YdiL (CAAX protease family)